MNKNEHFTKTFSTDATCQLKLAAIYCFITNPTGLLVSVSNDV